LTCKCDRWRDGERGGITESAQGKIDERKRVHISVCVCVCVCFEKERERERVRERERESNIWKQKYLKLQKRLDCRSRVEVENAF